MITLVIGKSDSGKSKLAEDLALAGDYKNRYYIATMKIMDDDGAKRVEKHQKQRAEKGFVTLEVPTDIKSAVSLMEDPEKSVALLECAVNLVGNEMHDNIHMSWLAYRGQIGEKEFAISVVSQISALADKLRDMIVVSAVYEPDPGDDEETALFKRLLGYVNDELRKVAGKVEEV